jgi:hypothetical protein
VTRPRAAFALALVAAGLLIVPARAAADASAAAAPTSPLAANGFASPSCTTQALSAQLSAAQRTDCGVSGVDVAPVPLSNYAIDIDIPSGLGASISDDLFTIVQDLLVTPVWTALVWLIHVVLIALEWCYAIDLLAPATLAHVSSSLGAARRVFTDPWLGLTLAVAAVGFAWQGLVRRRVLDTLGQAALLAVMVCGGLWIIADPTGTVGSVGNLADRAALSTVAASVTGDPSQPVATVDGAFAGVFDATISGPWCYLEFGDVDWCRQSTSVDPRLRSTAAVIAQQLRAEASCRGPVVGLVQCAPGGSALQGQLAGAATALGEATSNGQFFLALPPQAIERTALSDETAAPTLYGTLCGSSSATGCTAPTAPQAEFRTASGTWPRVGGLLLIVAGSLGMLLVFGFLALRLLGAALATLLYLLLAPLAVLAPALGEAGRDVFRLWLARLVGATLAKLVYSVALGVVLLIMSLLSSLDGLGWWTQWLLISVFWWTAFEHRHRVLGLVIHERGEPNRRAPLATRAWLAGRSVGAGLGVGGASGRLVAGAGGRAIETVKRIREFPREGAALSPAGAGSWRRGSSTGPETGGPVALRRDRRQGVHRELDVQVRRVQDVASFDARHAGGSISLARSERAALELRRVRIATGLRQAERDGDRRRIVSLQSRAARVQAALAAPRGGWASGRIGTTGAPLRSRLSVAVPPSLRRAQQSHAIARALDQAARAPAGGLLRAGERAAPLAGLAGLSPSEYLRRGPGEQRLARIEIERELARRRELLLSSGTTPVGARRSQVARPGAADGGSSGAPARRARQFGWRER